LLGSGLDDLAEAMRQAKSSVSIATPFLSFPVSAVLARAARDGRARKRRLLTAFNDSALDGGYLSADGLEAFMEADFEVRSLLNLHAKAVLIDKRWGLVGSGNLTGTGSDGGNAELGVVLSEAQAKEAQTKFFDHWWSKGIVLTVDDLRAKTHHLSPASQTPAAHVKRQRRGKGGIFIVPPGEELANFSADRTGSPYWLKIMYRPAEQTPVSYWRKTTWVSDAGRSDGAREIGKPTYAKNDHLVIYLAHGGHHACPAIFRVTEPAKWQPEIVAAENPGDENHRPWVTRVECIAAIPMNRAPSLSSIGVKPASVRRHSHIHLNWPQYRKAQRAIRGS
jgi:hypothetical protein